MGGNRACRDGRGAPEPEHHAPKSLRWFPTSCAGTAPINVWAIQSHVCRPQPFAPPGQPEDRVSLSQRDPTYVPPPGQVHTQEARAAARAAKAAATPSGSPSEHANGLAQAQPNGPAKHEATQVHTREGKPSACTVTRPNNPASLPTRVRPKIDGPATAPEAGCLAPNLLSGTDRLFDDMHQSAGNICRKARSKHSLRSQG